jgi:hypothetical protein
MGRPHARRSGLGNATSVARGVAVALFVLLAAAPPASPAATERVRPPDDLPCSRDELSLFAGTVSRYARTKTSLELTVDTEWDTHEPVTLRAADEAALTKHLRLDGKPFAAGDWSRLEASAGRLREGVRVKIWLCGKGTEAAPARVDWQSTSVNSGRPGSAP